jgi:dihydropteroate synthase
MSAHAPNTPWLLVTGRLAEHALREVAAQVAAETGHRFTLQVLPITVAALMSPAWIARHLEVPESITHVLLPGYCAGELEPLKQRFPNVVFAVGPRDLRRLGEFFGQASRRSDSYGAYDIAILAEINHAPRLETAELVRQALHYRDSGADVIDIGCDPGQPWRDVADAVKRLRDEGLRVSIDSFDPVEIAAAAQAGAELVLSVNQTNREAAPDWGCEVVVIPDDFATLGGLEASLDFLTSRGVRVRIDPILEPLGCGFAASLQRYCTVRARYPDAEIMLGIGNLTELTDCDSAGVNTLLMGFCQELGIRSVLTTEVINWARSSVRECDLARRLMHFAVTHRVPPKHIEPNLVMLRDQRVPRFAPHYFTQLAAQLKDHHYRLFAQDELLHVVAAGLHLSDADPFHLFERLLHPEDERTAPTNIDPAHAFYLGFELAKAQMAMQLGKEYRQDEALNWGFLTRHEPQHRVKLSGGRGTAGNS